ncbi:MAG: reductive dehalogenase, partial [Deltaproteobacteria bacterium]|nr:reductive dehalogenase [Deltaproteobacteria bacterium]
GIVRLDRRWVYSHTFKPKNTNRGISVARSIKVEEGESLPHIIPDEYQYAIVLVFEEDYEMIKYFPSHIAHAATSMGYSRMSITNNYLASFIRHLGYQTIDGTTNAVATTIPMAMQAGLGDIGRNGLLIHPKWGPRVRISKIITDLPMISGSPIDFGVTEFCSKCGLCADNCPSQAIMYGDRTGEPNNISNIRNTLKWPIDAEKCRMYWGRSNKPCTSCIGCCPFNKPDTLFHRTVRWFIDHVRWGDPLYVKADILCGYGKPKNPDRFWEEWEPKRH